MNKNYYVCLCFEDSLKTYQFFVGTTPYHYPAIQNVLYKDQKWFVIQMLGPLPTEQDANRLYQRWHKPNVNRGYLLTIGLELMQEYNLQMWSEDNPENPLRIQEKKDILPPLTVHMVKTLLNKEGSK